MFGHDDHDDNNKDESVVVDPAAPSAATSDSSSTDNSATATPPVSDEGNSVEDVIEGPEEAVTAPPAASEAPAASSPADSALLDLKKQALEELSPLVEHLDQTPEEKFKTIMMLIQATDSSNLITTAHQAAKAITDEKVRAQALLDIVNEINYFTQK